MSSSSRPVWIRRGTREYLRVSVALFLAGFATFSLLYCVQPLLPELARTFAVSPAQSALALSVSTACLAVSIVLAGALSEGLGRRRLMFISMALAALAQLLLDTDGDARPFVDSANVLFHCASMCFGTVFHCVCSVCKAVRHSGVLA